MANCSGLSWSEGLGLDDGIIPERRRRLLAGDSAVRAVEEAADQRREEWVFVSDYGNDDGGRARGCQKRLRVAARVVGERHRPEIGRCRIAAGLVGPAAVGLDVPVE